MAYFDGGEFISNDFDKDVMKGNFSTVSLALTGGYPVAKYFEPFLKLGLHKWKFDGTDYRFSSNTTTKGSDDGVSWFSGVGFDVPLFENVILRAEYEYYNIRNDSTKKLEASTFSAIYKF